MPYRTKIDWWPVDREKQACGQKPRGQKREGKITGTRTFPAPTGHNRARTTGARSRWSAFPLQTLEGPAIHGLTPSSSWPFLTEWTFATWRTASAWHAREMGNPFTLDMPAQTAKLRKKTKHGQTQKQCFTVTQREYNKKIQYRIGQIQNVFLITTLSGRRMILGYYWFRLIRGTNVSRSD